MDRVVGVICGVCGDVFRDLKWVQPCLELGIGDSVAFLERACGCGSVPVGVETIDADDMRQLEAQFESMKRRFGDG